MEKTKAVCLITIIVLYRAATKLKVLTVELFALQQHKSCNSARTQGYQADHCIVTRRLL